MKSKRKAVAQWIALAAGTLLLAGITVQAQDKKPDVAGTWTWSQQGRNGGPGRTNTLVLKVEGDKITGTLTSPGRRGGAANELKIEDPKLEGDQLSFKITRQFGGNEMVQKYSAKVEGDTLKGKIEFDRNGETQSRDFEAKRQAAKTEKM